MVIYCTSLKLLSEFPQKNCIKVKFLYSFILKPFYFICVDEALVVILKHLNKVLYTLSVK